MKNPQIDSRILNFPSEQLNSQPTEEILILNSSFNHWTNIFHLNYSANAIFERQNIELNELNNSRRINGAKKIYLQI